MKSWKLLMLCSLLALPFAQGAEKSGQLEGNGGDAMIDENGALVMRDFMSRANLEVVPDNKEFLDGMPEFLSLVRDLSLGDPGLAAQVWTDLAEAQIWFTDAALPLLPAAATAVMETGADVQVAIRYKNDIVISRPAFERVARKEYVFLHESLHALMQTTEHSGWHHEKVRSFVRYLEKHRGRYDANVFPKLMAKYGVSSISGTNSDIVGIMLREEGAAKFRCAVYQSYVADKDLYYGIGIGARIMRGLAAWGTLGACPKGEAKAEYERRYPALKAMRAKGNLFTIQYDLRVEAVRDGGSYFSVRDREDLLAYACGSFHRNETQKKFLAAERKAKQYLAALAQAKNDVITEADAAMALILKVESEADKEELKSVAEDMNAGRKVLQRNIQLCRGRPSR